MAKFKVGDKVLIDVWPDKGLVGTVKEIDYGGHPGNVYVDYGTGAGSVPESKLRPANSRACNSTNPVVANAMRASGGVARNATAFNIGTFASRLTRIVQDIEKVEDEIIAAMPDEIEAPQEYAKIERELLVPIQQAKQAFRRF